MQFRRYHFQPWRMALVMVSAYLITGFLCGLWLAAKYISNAPPGMSSINMLSAILLYPFLWMFFTLISLGFPVGRLDTEHHIDLYPIILPIAGFLWIKTARLFSEVPYDPQ